MSEFAIRAEGISKEYRIGQQKKKYKTLRDSLASAFSNSGGKNQRATGSGSFHALRDVSFEIQRGEVIGVIGRNGAGKSTLLKVLSRITEPSAGYIEIKGRVGSLLEVGTGFHPELSGRENIFLNGAILGMKKTEIARKFDEIVAFSEVERFIDTPVKHYSSGMYLKLAFAVAAHLETEILLIDEVLAVGDASFQKKCLNKMESVSNEGRTVLFVSHNMGAIQNLCTNVYLMEGGCKVSEGRARDTINQYLATKSACKWENDKDNSKDKEVWAKTIYTAQGGIESPAVLNPGEPFEVHIEYEVNKPCVNILLGFDALSSDGILLFRNYDTRLSNGETISPGSYHSVLTCPAGFFQSGIYYLELVIGIHRRGWISKNQIGIELDFKEARKVDIDYPGILQPVGSWK